MGIFRLSERSFVGTLEQRVLWVEISNLQDMFIITKIDWKYFWPHFEKQDGRHGRFFLVMKSALSPLLLVLEVCNVKPTYRKSWTANLLMWSDLTLGPSFKVK